MNNTEFYFAYGSNLFQKQMKKRCPSSVALYKATKINSRLCFPLKSKNRENMGVASINYELGSIVEGVIYRLSREDLEILDKFEGNGKRYTRKKIFIRLKDESKKLVWTYIASTAGSVEHAPSKNYLELIIMGAKEHKLSKQYLQALIRIQIS